MTSLIKRFESNRSFESLSELLNKLTEVKDRLKYIDKGLQLFPIQAILYLEKGKILYNQKQYKNAIEVLENGIDFVLDDAMIKNFYEILFKANDAIGNKEKSDKYKIQYNKIK